MENIYNLTYEELENFLINNNQKKYRTSQIFEWLYDKRVSSYDEMTNLSKDLILLLKNYFSIEKLEIVSQEIDTDVSKFLFKLKDKEHIESVLMRHNYGLSLCISSQV